MSADPTTPTTDPPYFYQNEPVTSVTWKAEPVSDRPTKQTTDDDYRDTLVRWLRHKERKWRDTAQSGVGAAADAASFYSAAYSNAAEGVALGQPERWAATENMK